MKAKMSYQNKKIAIITVIVLILIAGISIGAYSYFKGNADTEATSSENTTINNETMSEQNSVSEENNETLEETNTTENGSDANSSSDETNSESNNNANASNNNSNNDANSNENSSSESNDEELPNEEYTQTDYIDTGRQILVSESLKVGWMNANLLRDNVSAKIDVVKPTLELNKTAEINSVNAEDNSVQTGSEITYNITVTNTSETVDANNVTVKDTIPEGTSFAEGSIAINGALNSELTDADLARGIDVNVPAGETVTVSFTVVVTAENGEIRNAAVVDGKDTPETVNPVIEANKVATSKDEIVRNGSIISYTITVTNKSNIDAITSVKDTVPEGTTLEKVTTEGSSVNGGEISWNNVTLKAGETKTFTFDVKVDVFDGENKIIKNVAVVGNKETPETETEAHYPVISATKSTDKNSVKVGETLTYTITLTNSGIVDGDVKVVDSSPIGTTMVNSDNCVTVSNQEGKTYSEEELNNGINVTVPAGETVTVTFTVTVNESAEGSIKNTATIDDGTPTDEENPSVETPVIVTEKTAQVNDGTEAVEGTTVKKGDVITYRIKVTNTGSVAGKAIVKDSKIAGTTYVEGSLKIGEGENAEVQTAEEVAKFFGEGLEVDVAPGETVVSFQVTVDDIENVLKDGDTISNTAYVNGDPTNETETEYQEPVFESEKTANKGSVSVGEELEYTITVTNSGSIAGKAVVQDNAPEGTHFAPESTVTVSNSEKAYTTSELTKGIPVELDAGETAKVTFTVVVNESAEGAIINKATVNGDETGEEENPETQTPIITANKEVSAKTAKVGETLTYTITVKNTGSVEGTAEVKDSAPEGTTFKKGSYVVVSNDATQYTEQNLNEGIRVNVPANGEVTVTFEVTVNDLTDGTIIENVATINDKDTPKTETEYQEPVISSNKTSNKSAVVVGEEIEYTITVKNTGSVEGKAEVKDSAPKGTTFKEGSYVVVSNDATQYTEQNLNEGIKVNVPANGEITVKFTVTVNNDATGILANTAKVNEKDTPTTENPVITANKEVSAKTAKVGETLTYTITVKNTGLVAGTAEVKDSAPEGTTFKKGSYVVVSNDATQYTEQNLNEGIKVDVPANGEVTVTFEVTVNDLTDGTIIENVATINDKDTPKTETEYQEPVISSNKTSNKSAVVVGEEIEYTITVKNTGSVAGTAEVKDSAPTGTTFKEGSYVVVSNDTTQYTEQNLNEGIKVNVPANGEITVKFTVTVNNDATGILANTAKVNEKDTPTTENPVITANKEVSAKTAKVGETLTYTITVKNTGSVEGTAEVKDSAPEGTTFKEGSYVVVSNDATQYTEQNLNEGIKVDVPANGEVTVTFEVTVTGTNDSTELADGYVIENKAYVNDTPTETTETTYQNSNITVVKTSDRTENNSAVVAGDTITYTITATNTGSAEGTVIVRDPIDDEKVTLQGDIKVNDANLADATISKDTLENDGVTLTVPAKVGETVGTATITFTVKVNEGAKGSISNTAYVKDNEEDKEDPTDPVVDPIITAEKSATIKNADGTIKENANNQVKVGDIITYTITLTNTSTDNVFGTAIVKDEIPTGTSFMAGSIKINDTEKPALTQADIEGNNEQGGIKVTFTKTQPVQTISFDVKVVSGAQIKNTAKVNDIDTNTVTTTVVADYRVEHYYNNIIDDQATDYYYNIPVGTTIEEYNLKEKDDYKFVKVETVPLTITNGENVIKVYYETPVITATKTNDSKGKELQEGDEVTYTITVKNNGNVTGNAVITDEIPAGLTYNSYNATTIGENDTITTPNETSNTLTWNVNNLAKGEERTITITATVDEVEGEKQITNSVKVNGETTSTSTITVVEPTLTINKKAATVLDRDEDGNIIGGQHEDEAEVGDTIVYTITVENSSAIKAENVTIEDTLPSEVNFAGNMTTTGGDSKASYNSETRTISYNGSIPAKKTLTIKFNATVNNSAELKEGKVNEIANTAILKVDDKEKGRDTAETNLVKKVTVSTTAETINSLDLVLVLDTSDSMNSAMSSSDNTTRISNLKDAAKKLVSRLFSTETDSTLTLITYSDTASEPKTYRYSEGIIEELNGKGSGRWHQNGVIDNLKTGSGTNFYEALDKANEAVDTLIANDTANNRQRLVVFLTDGAPTFYFQTEGEKDANEVNESNDSDFKNNLRPQIIAQAEELKGKDVKVCAVSIGTSGLSDNQIQYLEKVDTDTYPEQTEIFDKTKDVWVSRKQVGGSHSRPIYEYKYEKYYYMYQKEYAEYILNNIDSSGKYTDSSNLINTFDSLLSSFTTNKWSYRATELPMVIRIPEEREIIDNEVTVQIGNNSQTINLSRLTNGNNYQGLTYQSTADFTGFVWTIDESNEYLFDTDLAISVKVKGVAEDNQ